MDFVQVIKTKYPHLDESTANSIVNKAKMFYYLHKYSNFVEKKSKDEKRD